MTSPVSPLVKLPEEAPKPKTVQLFDMQAVHGLLIHPYTGTRFVKDKKVPHEKDRWCESQIEGGKLALV